MKYILASQSPRRKEILFKLGIEFKIIPAMGDEIITSSNPANVVEQLSLQKAKEVYQMLSEDSNEALVVIGADTVVAKSGEILGKPQDKDDAFRMLKMLSGDNHSVFTGVTIIYASEEGMKHITFHDETKVYMYEITDDEIWSMIDSGEPMDKAGAYAIQGLAGKYIYRIEGDYDNVVGLPGAKLLYELKNTFNLDV